MPPEELKNYSSLVTPKPNRDVGLRELQNVVDQRFSSIDLGDQVTRDSSKIVGSGNYGLVYEGTLRAEHKKVAVKVIRYGDKSARPELERVLREVYIWSKLNHENIITLLGITTVFDHSISIVSPLMSRGNVFEYVQNTDVDPRPLILGIANALYYLHTYKQGSIIHGDIKGTNILVSDDGHALLTDFGFSHLANASFSLAIEQRPGGTPDWMPPEYLEMAQCVMTPAGDVWSFGMTALELFIRKRPYGHLGHHATIKFHIIRTRERERPTLEDTCSRLTDEWWNICSSCWTRDPLRRPSILTVIEGIRSLQTMSTVCTFDPSEASHINMHGTPEVVTKPLPPDGTHLDDRLSKENRSHLQDEYAVAQSGTLDLEKVTMRHMHSSQQHPRSDPLEPREQLAELALRASEYSLNLDGLVSKDSRTLLRGGHAVVYSGFLLQRENPDGILGGGPSEARYMTKVAIKTPRGGPPGSITYIKAFLREVHVWSKLCHANVLPLLGITTQYDLTVSIVSPWMSKGNAHNYVLDKAIDPRPLITGIAQGLHYLHNLSPRAIFHGDLKGDNVLVSDDGQALLADFGLSFVVNSSFDMSVSSFDGPKGTFNWMSPELFYVTRVSAEADVWAFGMTALELFTRKRPFYYLIGLNALISKVVRGHVPERPSIEDTCSRMSNMWWNMCTRCWEFDPSLRPTIAHIVEQIEKMTSPEPFPLDNFARLASSYIIEPLELDGTASISGNKSVVYQGRLENGTKVAVKALRYSPLDVADAIKRVVDDISTWCKLRHNNILPVLGVTTKFDHAISLVSLWTAKGNAHDYVQNNDVSPDRLLIGVASGLCYLHAHNPHPIYHGNLRGHNILISDGGHALLTDFGLSQLLGSSFILENSAPHPRSMNWTSPEHLDDFKGSAEGDVWAFGMTALELFTRSYPFHDIQNSTELKQCVRRGLPERPSDGAVRSHLTDEWWNILSSCWELDPRLRPSIEEIAHRAVDELVRVMWRTGRGSEVLQILQ